MAMYENGNKLDEEVMRLTEKLATLDPTSDDYKAVRMNLDSLYKLRNEQYKAEIDIDEKALKRETDKELKEEELKIRTSEVELAEKQREDAVAKVEAEQEQKANELEVKKSEVELAEKQREDANKRFESEMQHKSEELELRARELELAEKQREDAVARAKAENEQKMAELEVRKMELELSDKQHTDMMVTQKKDRTRDYIVTGVQVVSGILKLGAVIVGSLIVSDWGYKFEESGTPTSPTFRNVTKTWADLIKDLKK